MSSNRYVSCVLGCPYEGQVEPSKVAEVRQNRIVQPHSWVCSMTDPLWCVWRCAAGGEKTVRNGLLRDFLGRHHRHRYPGLHVQDAAKRDEGGARQCASGALPRHVRTSAGQHPDCAAGKQLPTRVYRVRIWFQASCGTFSKAASTERALCWWLLVTVVI